MRITSGVEREEMDQERIGAETIAIVVLVTMIVVAVVCVINIHLA